MENIAQQTNTQLIDKLQSLTHSLAMASAAAGEGGASTMCGPFSLISNKRYSQDLRLVKFLSTIITCGEHPTIEAQYLACQSINYIMGLDPRVVYDAFELGIMDRYFNILAREKTEPFWERHTEEVLNGIVTFCTSSSKFTEKCMEPDNFDLLLGILKVDRTPLLVHVLPVLQKMCNVLQPLSDDKVPAPSKSSSKKKKGKAAFRKAPLGIIPSRLKNLVDALTGSLDNQTPKVGELCLKCLSSIAQRAMVHSVPLDTLLSDAVILKFVRLLVDSQKGLLVRNTIIELLSRILQSSPPLLTSLLEKNICSTLNQVLLQVIDTTTQESVGRNMLKLMDVFLRLICSENSTIRQSSDMANSSIAKRRRRSRIGSVSSFDGQWVCGDEVEVTTGSKAGEVGTIKRVQRDGKYIVQLQSSGNEVKVPNRNLQKSRQEMCSSPAFKRPRLDSAPDPNVLQTHFLNFVRSGETRIVRKLLRDGVAVDQADTNKDTALIVAAAYAPLDLVRLLLRRGASVSTCGRTGPPLHAAARRGRVHIVACLLHEGADIEQLDSEGKSARDVATGDALMLLEKLEKRQRSNSDAVTDILDDFAENTVGNVDEQDEGIDMSGDDDSVDSSDLLYEYGSDGSDEGGDPDEAQTFVSSCPAKQPTISLEKRIEISRQVLKALLEAFHAAKTKGLRKNVRALIATLLELSPADLVRQFEVPQLTLILDLAHAQLLDAKDQITSGELDGLRMLQALLRKSNLDSPFYRCVKRRGIYDLVLHISHIRDSDNPSTKTLASIAALFVRHFDLKFMNGADEFPEISPKLSSLVVDLKSNMKSEKALVALASLTNDPDGITAHEFNAARLSGVLLEYLDFDNEVELSSRIAAFKAAFFPQSSSPEDEEPLPVRNLILLLNSVLATTEKLPVSTFPSPTGKPFHSLTRPIKIELWRVDGSGPPVSSRVIMAQPLVKFSQLEKAILRNTVSPDEKYVAYCHSLTGTSIMRKVGNGRFQEFKVLGFDLVSGAHLILPVKSGSSSRSASGIEVRLHEENYKFCSETVQVKGSAEIDISEYGSLVEAPKRGPTTRRTKRSRPASVSEEPGQKRSKSNASTEGSFQSGTVVQLFPGRSRGVAGVVGTLANRIGTIRSVNPDRTLNVQVEGDPKTYRITARQCRIPSKNPSTDSKLGRARIGERVWIESTVSSNGATPGVVLSIGADDYEISVKMDKSVKLKVETRRIIRLSSTLDAGSSDADTIPELDRIVQTEELQLKVIKKKGKGCDIRFTCKAPPQLRVKLGLHDRFRGNGDTFSMKSCLCTESSKKSLVLKPNARQAFQSIFDKFAVGVKSKASAKRRASLRSRSTAGSSSSSTTPKVLTAEKFREFVAASFPLHVLLRRDIDRDFRRASKDKNVMTIEGFFMFVCSLLQDSKFESAVWHCLRLYSFKESDFITIPERQAPIDMHAMDGDFNILLCFQRISGGDQKIVHKIISESWKSATPVYYQAEVDWDNDSATSETAANWPTEKIKLGSAPQYKPIGHLLENSVPLECSQALELLSFVHFCATMRPQLPVDLWHCTKISMKIDTQLKDVLSVIGSIYPAWCAAIPVQCRFLIPYETRLHLFRATAFGWVRSLHWIQSELDIVGGDEDELDDSVGIAPMRRERIKVQRENILQSAENLMLLHAKRKAPLEIVFSGERGYGSGVTAAFYSAVAYELQRLESNLKVPCWLRGHETLQDEVIRHPAGLFPLPQIDVAGPVIKRFELMGRLAGKAIMDERLLPLPLSLEFMKLVLNEPVTESILPKVFLEPGKTILSLFRVVEEMKQGKPLSSIQIDGLNPKVWLESACLEFVDPISGRYLDQKRASSDDVTLNNLAAYVDAVMSLWLDTGLTKQIGAFRRGFSLVIPFEKLKLFSASELLDMIRGCSDVEWDHGTLSKVVSPASGYSKTSDPYLYFIEALSEMTAVQRREFLLFATGCPSLPPGGISKLDPPFKVSRRQATGASVDAELPFARTCTNTLHLPPYSSKERLIHQLEFAIQNSKGTIDRD